MGVWLWVPGVLIDHMMLILLLACSLAGCIAVTSMHPALATSAVLVHGAFLIGPTATSHDGLERTLAALAAAFTIMIAVQGVALCLRSTKMLRLEHEQKGLVQELRSAKEESDRAKARAVQAGQARSQFFSHMNHELRTPMNAILGFSEMIHNKAFGQNVDKYAEYAGIIHESGTTLLTLIDNVLNLSKIQNGQMYLRESDVDLCGLLLSGMEQYETKAVEAQVSLSLEAPRGLPLVRGDERALRQILVNLLSNAIKFTPAGGKVNLFAQMETDDRIAFGVEDTGSGIELEDQGDVFERFGFGRHDVTTADRGTGLGLAIVKGFTEAHDGEVLLQSAPGKGTRVTVYMPAYRVIAPGALKTA
jgi:two-component system cell cycle sensor histidine kinase PleC